ncbi:hypothetical protein AQ436_16445 [Arthrobacter sp. EpRS66]|nr:hypothetical protein AQ436_16445 [Arthrobacter sp. EpRS66]
MLAILLPALVCVPPYGRPSAEARIYHPVSEAQKQCLKTAVWPEDESSPLMNSDIPKARVVNIGFEDVTSADPARIPDIARELNSVNATGVSISVGRLDWIGFPWAENKDRQSSEVQDTGRDYVREAINAFICSDRGVRRTISLNIDTLLGRELEHRPEIAGINAQGTVSKNWTSVSSWKHSGLTERLASLTSELVHRYSLQSINITEMMFPSYTFSDADLADFQDFSSLGDWPRNLDGSIDTDATAIHEWRSDAVEKIMAEVASRLSGTGVELTMDVRSPVDSDLRGRLDSGQDYAALLQIVDRLNIWNFQGINSTGYYATDQLADFFVEEDPARYGIEIGLWDQDGAISPETLEHELRLAEERNVPRLSITPTSLMDQKAWDILRRVWGSPESSDNKN